MLNASNNTRVSSIFFVMSNVLTATPEYIFNCTIITKKLIKIKYQCYSYLIVIYHLLYKIDLTWEPVCQKLLWVQWQKLHYHLKSDRPSNFSFENDIFLLYLCYLLTSSVDQEQEPKLFLHHWNHKCLLIFHIYIQYFNFLIIIK